jgi:hypothetical protein
MSGTKPTLVPPPPFASRMLASAERLRSSSQRAGLSGDPMGEVVDGMAEFLAALPEALAELQARIDASRQPPMSRGDQIRGVKEGILALWERGMNRAAFGLLGLVILASVGVGMAIEWARHGPEVIAGVATGQPCTVSGEWKVCPATVYLKP